MQGGDESSDDRGRPNLLISPDGGLIARELGAGALEVVLPGQGFRTEASGVVADEIRDVLAGQAPSPRLTSLSAALPWLRMVTECSGPARAMTFENILRQDDLGLLFVEVTGNCNERCEHCYADAGPSVRASLSRGQVFDIIDDAATLGFRSVQFTGGDPLLCQFLVEAVARATETNLHVEIYTNGLLLTEKRLARLVPYRPSFAFSVYSHVPAFHDQVTRTPGSLKKTLAAIERSVAAGLPTRVGLVAMKSNYRSLKRTIAVLRDLGVEQLNVTPSFEVGRGEQYLGELPEDVAQGHGGDASERGPALGKLCVTYEGQVVPCIFNREQVLGTITSERGLADIVARPSTSKSGVPLDAFLRRCSSQLQCGDCRTTAAALELMGSAS